MAVVGTYYSRYLVYARVGSCVARHHATSRDAAGDQSAITCTAAPVLGRRTPPPSQRVRATNVSTRRWTRRPQCVSARGNGSWNIFENNTLSITTRRAWWQRRTHITRGLLPAEDEWRTDCYLNRGRTWEGYFFKRNVRKVSFSRCSHRLQVEYRCFSCAYIYVYLYI